MTVPRPTVKISGPLFDGRAQAAMDAFLDEVTAEVAEDGVNDVQAELGRVLRNPTGFYESQIQTQRQRDDQVVTDGGVIYGPWLAGTSSRNQTTSFKGYDHWRRATQRLDSRAGSVAGRILRRFLPRMN